MMVMHIQMWTEGQFTWRGEKYRNQSQNPQMIQVAISDPFNKEVFYPTDNIIVLKHQG